MARALSTFSIAAVFSVASFFIGWQASAIRLTGGSPPVPAPAPFDGGGGAPTHPPLAQ